MLRLSIVMFLLAAITAAAPLNHSFMCPMEKIMTVHNRTADRIIFQCSTIDACGLSTTCSYSKTSTTCNSGMNYVAGVLEKEDMNDVTVGCCTFTPAPKGATENCYIYEIITPAPSADDTAAAAAPVPSLDDPMITRSLNDTLTTLGQQIALGGTVQMQLVSPLEPVESIELVKSVQKVKRGYRVLLCKLQCQG